MGENNLFELPLRYNKGKMLNQAAKCRVGGKIKVLIFANFKI